MASGQARTDGGGHSHATRIPRKITSQFISSAKPVITRAFVAAHHLDARGGILHVPYYYPENYAEEDDRLPGTEAQVTTTSTSGRYAPTRL